MIHVADLSADTHMTYYLTTRGGKNIGSKNQELPALWLLDAKSHQEALHHCRYRGHRFRRLEIQKKAMVMTVHIARN